MILGSASEVRQEVVVVVPMHMLHSLEVKYPPLLLMLVVQDIQPHRQLQSLVVIHQQLKQLRFRVVKTNHLAVQQEQDI